ncbi:MAG: hypothetical protein IPN10_03070 [Saprospiraceae bacterium]|nr:hypothetical protein [Saprospiraceae bacterium]
MSVIVNGDEINLEVKSSINQTIESKEINIEVTGARGETGEAGTPAPERKILIFSYAFLGGQVFIDTEIVSNTFGETPEFSCSEDGKLRLAFSNIQNKYPVWQILNRQLEEFTKGNIIHGDDSFYCVHDPDFEQGYFMAYVEFFEINTTVISNI